MELIDREKIKSTIRAMVEIPNEVRSNVLGAISRAKAVDAVLVVRCKNCAWCHNLEDLNYCENPNAPWISAPEFDDVTVGDDDFCSYGERKDNG